MILECLGSILAYVNRFWCLFCNNSGFIFGQCDAHLGLIWVRIRGQFGAHFGAYLGANVGTSWCSFGVILVLIWGQVGAHLGLIWGLIWGQVGAHLGLIWQLLVLVWGLFGC